MGKGRCVCGVLLSYKARGLCRICYLREQAAQTASSLADRFWAKVDRRGPNECWPWTGSTDRYGRLGRGGKRGGPLFAHRVSWELHYGPIEPGMWVLHRCDNPPCVNPSHLFLGTHEHNMADMVAKGRSTSGDRNPARLYPERVQRGDQHWKRRHALSVGTGKVRHPVSS